MSCKNYANGMEDFFCVCHHLQLQGAKTDGMARILMVTTKAFQCCQLQKFWLRQKLSKITPLLHRRKYSECPWNIQSWQHWMLFNQSCQLVRNFVNRPKFDSEFRRRIWKFRPRNFGPNWPKMAEILVNFKIWPKMDEILTKDGRNDRNFLLKVARNFSKIF